MTASLGGCNAKDRTADGADGSERPKSAVQMAVDEGCPHQKDGTCDSPQAPGAAGGAEKQAYGAPLGTSPQVALTALLETPEKYHDQTVRVKGHVKRACAKKGCWMEIATDATADAKSCRVTFKDYGFLVPTTSAGSHATLEARVQLTQVKPEAVSHYEAEGAQFPNKKPDGSAVEVRLVATGVELERI